ncbi:unnamed protein product [Cyclocybe aegerita]|uniref:Uncharacterized protein n=1 Tax=Cyclocybe aegerita TaxID=1973307 RepID=A0A8S0WUZ9_CYCAE|nr:unnamed protein product [Cyclocybe aegerita]
MASRRKPQFTYKSPTAQDSVLITLSRPKTKTNGTHPRSTKTSRSNSSQQEHRSRHVARRMHPTSPPLPLFHPLGYLAMSLPPLDPIRYGLPVLATPDEPDDQSSHRSRRAAKLRENDEDIHAVPSPTVSTIAAVAAREAKERASPRKRRVGGAKRKRRDADDGDATYPAKRTRVPRTANGQTEEDPVVDGEQQSDVAVVPEGLAEFAETAQRRSTRSKAIKRRDSSASETTSNLGSAPAVSAQPAGDATTPTIATTIDAVAEKVEGPDRLSGNDEKEEGELSEEQPNP